MWAVRAFVVKTLSGHSRHTYTLWTLVFFHHALTWGVRLGCVVWSCQWEQCCFVFVFLSRSLSLFHTLIDSLFSYSLSHALTSSLSFGWQCTPNKMEFGTFAKDCWTAIKYATVGNCQYARCRLGSGYLMMPMSDGGALELWCEKTQCKWEIGYPKEAHKEAHSVTWVSWWIDQHTHTLGTK